MAIGDILSVSARPEGCWVDIKLAELGTGGTYDFGLGPANDPAAGTPKVVFTVVSQGYANGVLGTRTRTIYGTTRVRKPFSVSGDELTAQETVDGSDVIVRIALSESIYDSDNSSGGTGGNSGVVPTVTILAGFYTQGGTPNNAVSNFTVTNNSTLAYPRVIGNWSRAIAYDKVGITWRVGVAVFHGHAQSGQQVDCVKFTAADASGHSDTVTVSAATIDATYGDAVPVIEHIANLNTSGFTQGDTGTLNFIAYPFIGNGASVLDTAGVTSGSTAGTGTAAAPTPYYGPLAFVCDPAGTYCTSFAVIDAANGDDGTGAVGVGTLDPLNPPAAYATPFAAFNAVRAYNNTNYSRNNCGGSIFYLRDNAGGVNSFAWTGGSITAGTRPACALTLTRYPGHARDNVVIASQSGARTLGEIVKIVGIKITATHASSVFDVGTATSYLHLDQCEIDSSLSPTINRVGVWSVTRSLISNFAQGFAQFGGTNSACILCRGNTLPPTSTSLGQNKAYTILGNRKLGTLQHVIGTASASPVPNQANMVVAYNWISATNATGPMLNGGFTENTHGSAIVQNVIENRGNGSQCFKWAADLANVHCNNVVIFHNTFIGERASMAYNEQGATGWTRLNWFVKSNIADDYNLKGDCWPGLAATATRSFSAGTVTVTVTQSNHQLFTGDLIYITVATPAAYKTNGVAVTVLSATQFTYTFSAASDPGAISAMQVCPHPARIGQWPVVYGVNHSGNVWAETSGIGAGGTFMQSFTGIRCLPSATANEPPVSPPNVLGYLKFVDRKSYNGSTTGAGGGDYRLRADSPAVGRASNWILPFGLDGRARKLDGAAGAYDLSDSRGLLLRRRRKK